MEMYSDRAYDVNSHFHFFQPAMEKQQQMATIPVILIEQKDDKLIQQ